MRITKAALMSRWTWSTALTAAVFAVLWVLDLRLKALSGVGTADIQAFSTAGQFRAAFWAWAPEPYAVRAGFNLGFDFLLMPLYAMSFFYSGVVAAEAFAPRPGRLRRIILLAAMMPLVGAACDAAENVLEIAMLLNGADDMLARLAFGVSNAKTVALTVGGVLLAAALVARFPRRPKNGEPAASL
jgi:hypothetical protein